MRLIAEVFVPAIDMRFDFTLPALMDVRHMKELIAQLISVQARLDCWDVSAGFADNILLFYKRDNGQCEALHDRQTLLKVGASDGCQLILV